METKGKKKQQKLTFLPFPGFPPFGFHFLLSQPFFVSFYFFSPDSPVKQAAARVVMLSVERGTVRTCWQYFGKK